MPTYTSFKDVKSLLRSSDGKVVRFSGTSLQTFRVEESETSHNPASNLYFDRTALQVDPSFGGHYEIRLKFDTDTTYDVLLKPDDDISQRMMVAAQGHDYQTDYTTPDGVITIEASGFEGTPNEGNVLDFHFDAHMSKKHAKDMIEDVEVEIDSMLSAQQIDQLEDTESRLFNPNDSRPVPNAIKVAARYLSAYYIFTDTFVENFAEGGASSSYADRWKKRAEKMLNLYIDREGYNHPKIHAEHIEIEPKETFREQPDFETTIKTEDSSYKGAGTYYSG